MDVTTRPVNRVSSNEILGRPAVATAAAMALTNNDLASRPPLLCHRCRFGTRVVNENRSRINWVRGHQPPARVGRSPNLNASRVDRPIARSNQSIAVGPTDGNSRATFIHPFTITR